TGSASPIAVAGLGQLASISAGSEHSLALKPDGTVWAWGRNDWGELGDGSNYPSGPSPVQVQGLANVTVVAGGGEHSLAIKSAGTAWGWGLDESGQLGSGQASQSCIYFEFPQPCEPLPVQVVGLSGVTAIAGGFEHSLAVTADGAAWAWGDDSAGQLGD